MSGLGKISTTGALLSLELRQGATLQPVTLQINNPDGTPVDLTGCQVRGQIRRKALDATVVASFATALAGDPTEGWCTFGLSDEATAAITCGDTLADAASLYEFDVEIEFADGSVRCIVYGPVRVKPEVTRPV